MSYATLLADLAKAFPKYNTNKLLVVEIHKQCLCLVIDGVIAKQWLVSTASAGIGNQRGSGKTPLGVHRIAQCIGEGEPFGAVFTARVATGAIASITTAAGQRTGVDCISSRILWLDGLEEGLNRGGDLDSMSRYIYIHGTNEEGCLGTPVSHGCIRMANQAIIDLFTQVHVNMLVVVNV